MKRPSNKKNIETYMVEYDVENNIETWYNKKNEKIKAIKKTKEGLVKTIFLFKDGVLHSDKEPAIVMYSRGKLVFSEWYKNGKKVNNNKQLV
jgi:hypothetical protein